MDQHVRELDRRITSVELHIEKVTDKKIQLLAENYVPAAKCYEKSSARIDVMEADIDVLKRWSLITVKNFKCWPETDFAAGS